MVKTFAAPDVVGPIALPRWHPALFQIETFDRHSVDTQQKIVKVLKSESAAIASAIGLVDAGAAKAVDLLFECSGRIIVTGMGKMGCIARKAAATFCSTGAPAVFLHPAEAVHGDLGIVTEKDVLIVLSNSGETREVIQLLPYVARTGIKTIAICAGPNCSLAQSCDAVLATGVTVEADSIAVAPTNSTTVTLALCDALAVALMDRRGFTRDQFAIFHPGGHLGSKLLIKVADLMRSADQLPIVDVGATLGEAIQEISSKGIGATFAVDRDGRLVGVLTDGDLRRVIENSATQMNGLIDGAIDSMITTNPKTSTADSLAASALRLMEDNGITVLPVVDAEQKMVGVIHLHDLIRAGLA